MTRSVLLRLLRARCNACELAFFAGCEEPEMRRQIRALERCVSRRIRRKAGKWRAIRLAA